MGLKGKKFDVIVLSVIILMGTMGGIGFYNTQIQNAEKMKTLIYNFFSEDKYEDFDSYFDPSIKNMIDLDTELYFLELVTGFQDAFGPIMQVKIADPMKIAQSYGYDIIFENGYVSGQISLNPSSGKLLGLFMKGFGFYYDYLLNSSLNDLVIKLNNISSISNLSLIIARDGAVYHEINPDQVLQVGSAFKLFVLKALTDEIANNDSINWNTPISIRDDCKSLPSGILQTYPAGFNLTLKQMADYMINISDNTATDHLISFLGRTKVENSLPALYSKPILKTSEAFKLKLLVDDANYSAYLKMSENEKRIYLENELSKVNISEYYRIEQSINYTRAMRRRYLAEWSFSSRQLLNIHNLTKLSDSTWLNPGLAYSSSAIFNDTFVLSLVDAISGGSNGGASTDQSRIINNLLSTPWNITSFKGGGDTGVYSLSHALMAKNGSWYQVVLIVNNYIEDDGVLINYGNYVKNQMAYTLLATGIIEKLRIESLLH